VSSGTSSSKTSSSSKTTGIYAASSKAAGYTQKPTGTVFKGKIIGISQTGFVTLYNNQLVPYDHKS
jgi:hypothetical protein